VSSPLNKAAPTALKPITFRVEAARRYAKSSPWDLSYHASMVRFAMALLALMLLGTASSCFKPDLGDGLIRCGAGGLCPEGYFCRDRYCYRGDHHDDDDLSVPVSEDMSSGGDLATPGPDLAGDDVDLAGNGGCVSGVFRVCLDATTSAVCANGAPVADRVCPPGSSCANGRCQPPAGGGACIRNTECTAGTLCVGYADTGTLHGVCTQPVPGSSGGESAACASPGYDSYCQSGLCVRANQGAVVCAFACRMPVDCPVAAGQTATCQAVAAPATLEGVALNARTCVVQ
jgi:hypothetical protein